jgi:MYXO-CTERM domain-containing protein
MSLALITILSGLSMHAFTWNPPGRLQSGNEGRVDERVYAPGMRYPIEDAPSYPNSQVYAPGGSHGPGGGQCAAINFSYPWSDNFCEPRRWDMPMCPGGTGHQGQDIRPATCGDKAHWAVAAEAGQITSIGSYSVYLVTDSGRRHRYLHLAPETLEVRQGQRVERGARIGKVSNAFFDSDGNRVGTTVHLHYDIHMAIAELGRAVYVPPYMSLVRSYEPLVGEQAARCPTIPSQGGVLDETGPCFQRWGAERYWRYVEGAGHDGSYLWTNAFVNETPSNWGRWTLNLAQAGRYAVEVNIVAPHNVAQRVGYLVKAAGQEQRVRVSQGRQTGWLRLGEFDFAAGGEQKIEVFDNSDEEGADLHMTVDALRLLAVEVEVVVSDAGWSADAAPVDSGRRTPTEPAGCGCVSGADLSGFALLILGGLLRRRRRVS